MFNLILSPVGADGPGKASNEVAERQPLIKAKLLRDGDGDPSDDGDDGDHVDHGDHDDDGDHGDHSDDDDHGDDGDHGDHGDGL